MIAADGYGMFDPAQDLDLGNRPYWTRVLRVAVLASGLTGAVALLIVHLSA